MPILTTVIPFGALFLGAAHITAGEAALLVASSAAFISLMSPSDRAQKLGVAVAGSWFLGEAVTVSTAIGALLIALGMVGMHWRSLAGLLGHPRSRVRIRLSVAPVGPQEEPLAFTAKSQDMV